MNTFNKQILKAFGILTVMPLITASIGSFMNFVFSLVFMFPFVEIQQSPVWIFHAIIGIIFTVMLLTDLDND
jgi:hypothetical protein